ncbi:hypothetical protein R6Z07F_004502 [Ovis aries]
MARTDTSCSVVVSGGQRNVGTREARCPVCSLALRGPARRLPRKARRELAAGSRERTGAGAACALEPGARRGSSARSGASETLSKLGASQGPLARAPAASALSGEGRG